MKINSIPINYTGNQVRTNNHKNTSDNITNNTSDTNYRENKANAAKTLVLASMILASLGGTSACKGGYVSADNGPQIETVDSLGGYKNDIDDFMEDDNIAKVNTTDTVDSRYESNPRVIYSHGYDDNGNLVKSLEIHPAAEFDSTFQCPEPEYKYTTYYKDRKETNEYDMDEFQRKEIKYKDKVTLDGVPGYTKTEVISPDKSKVLIYKKELYEPQDGTIVANNQIYHERVVMYDAYNKKKGTLNFRRDKNGEMKLDEKHSDIPSDY